VSLYAFPALRIKQRKPNRRSSARKRDLDLKRGRVQVGRSKPVGHMLVDIEARERVQAKLAITDARDLVGRQHWKHQAITDIDGKLVARSSTRAVAIESVSGAPPFLVF
jgi:hypothetical protein